MKTIGRHAPGPALTAAAVAVLVFVGCTSPSSTPETRKARVPEFALSPSFPAPDAYHAPNAQWSPNMASTIPKYTGGGLLPVLIGATVDKQVTSGQQNAFDSNQAALLPTINAGASVAPFSAIDVSISTAIRKNAFLAGKIRDNSKNRLETKIIRFGLVKKNREEEIDPMMSAEILVEVTLRVEDGAPVKIGGFSGSSSRAFSMSALSKEPDRIQMLYREAADSLVDLISKIMKIKYGE